MIFKILPVFNGLCKRKRKRTVFVYLVQNASARGPQICLAQAHAQVMTWSAQGEILELLRTA